MSLPSPASEWRYQVVSTKATTGHTVASPITTLFVLSFTLVPSCKEARVHYYFLHQLSNFSITEPYCITSNFSEIIMETFPNMWIMTKIQWLKRWYSKHMRRFLRKASTWSAYHYYIFFQMLYTQISKMEIHWRLHSCLTCTRKYCNTEKNP